MSVLILGEVHIAPSRLSEFKEFKIYLRELLPDSRAYDGFEKVELYENKVKLWTPRGRDPIAE